MGPGETHWFEWAQADAAANLLGGFRIRGATVDGFWASTLNLPYSSAPPYGYQQHDLRSESALPAMDLQAVRVMAMGDGSTAVVLGCPGGRVRIVRPGNWAVPNVPHGLGTLSSSATDLGNGGAALAARLEVNGTDLSMWFGTAYAHGPRPAAYAAGSLGNGEVLTGSITRLTWSASGGFTMGATRLLSPTGSTGIAARGAYGVCGIAVAELVSANAGAEVIVTTLAGDLWILSEDLQTVVWQSWVDGAVGVYNAIIVADLDGDTKQELYVAGSRGVWRFIQP